jgi:hypothetical protein
MIARGACPEYWAGAAQDRALRSKGASLLGGGHTALRWLYLEVAQRAIIMSAQNLPQNEREATVRKVIFMIANVLFGASRAG